MCRVRASRRWRSEANALGADLAEVDYCVLIGGGGFTVRNYKSEADYSAEILDTFDKFKQGAVNDYLVQYRSAPEAMNHIEAKIVEFVAKLHRRSVLAIELLL